MSYTFNVHNKGPGSAVLATLDGGVSGGNILTVATTQGNCTTGTLQCNLGTIASSGGVRVTMVALVSVASGSTFTPTAGANACTFDPATTNNTVSATTKVTP